MLRPGPRPSQHALRFLAEELGLDGQFVRVVLPDQLGGAGEDGATSTCDRRHGEADGTGLQQGATHALLNRMP